VRLFQRNDTSLAAALIVGVFLLFHQPLQIVFDSAHEVEREYHIDLVQSLVVLCAVFAFHQYRKQQRAKAALVAADADVQQAHARAYELERLVGLSRAVAVAADFTALYHAFQQYLPKFTYDRASWLLLLQEECWDVLVRGASDRRPAEELEAIAARALAACAGAGSTRVDDLTCFPLIVGGHAVGVLLVEDKPPLGDPDSRALEGAAAVAAVAIRNIQALLEARENSLRDRLTGCFNRGHAVDTLNSELRRARRTHMPVSVIMFDVDYFKQVNDSHGHLTGDRVLAEVGRRLSEILRASDVKCRYGGDEFLLILPDTPSSGARKLAESILGAMGKIVVQAGAHGVTVTVSIGVVTTHGDDHVDACIARADAALYRAKRDGRNCFRIAEPAAAETAPTPGATIEHGARTSSLPDMPARGPARTPIDTAALTVEATSAHSLERREAHGNSQSVAATPPHSRR